MTTVRKILWFMYVDRASHKPTFLPHFWQRWSRDKEPCLRDLVQIPFTKQKEPMIDRQIIQTMRFELVHVALLHYAFFSTRSKSYAI